MRERSWFQVIQKIFRVFQNPHVIYATTRVNSFTIFLFFYTRICETNFAQSPVWRSRYHQWNWKSWRIGFDWRSCRWIICLPRTKLQKSIFKASLIRISHLCRETCILQQWKELWQIRVITKLPNSEQSYKGKVKTHKYVNRQNQSTTGNCENRNDSDLAQAFLKKWWVESDFKAPNLPLSLRFKVSAVTITVFITKWKCFSLKNV